MTAETRETDSSEENNTNEGQNAVGEQGEEAPPQQQFELPPQILDIFEFLSCNTKIVFKSQQIDDPELHRSEKIQIAREIYEKNRQTFLMRFGSYFTEAHLTSFAQMAIADGAEPLKSDEHCEEMQLMLLDYRHKLHTRTRDVKNRRYVAMQRLIKQGEYFSEQEMMLRAPELYQELVGQYLSEAEKKQRDGYDVKNTTFSGILMHTMVVQKEMADRLEQADKQIQWKDANEDDTSSNSNSKEHQAPTEDESETTAADEEEEIPVSFRQQWGNFDNEQIACSTSRQAQATAKQKKSESVTKPKSLVTTSSPTFITAGERDLLHEEFVGVMQAQFLAGNDKDFDYTQVDDNTQLDDLQQLNQDKEDAYFEASDDDDEEAIVKSPQGGLEEHSNMDESEDELDIYMSALSKHHSLQK